MTPDAKILSSFFNTRKVVLTTAVSNGKPLATFSCFFALYKTIMQASETSKNIAISAQRCVQFFRTCLLCPNIRDDALDEQYARILIWIENMGVFAPPHLSLDHRLRNAYSIRHITNELLELLQETVDYCM